MQQWGNAGLAAPSTPDYKLTFPHFRTCWARSQGNELTFWICIPFASVICNQSCWWYAWMAADRNDRVSVIAGTLSVEAPPSNAAQWMPASSCPSKTLCFLCLPPPTFSHLPFGLISASLFLLSPPWKAILEVWLIVVSCNSSKMQMCFREEEIWSLWLIHTSGKFSSSRENKKDVPLKKKKVFRPE